MLFDDGVCIFYALQEAGASATGQQYTLREKSRRCFGELTTGYGRHYEAKRQNEQIDMSIRVWADRTVRPADICEIAGERYRIRQIQPRTDEDGLKVTDLALERTEDDGILEAEVVLDGHPD